jgi:ectoine hydroxylase-related dioxygenase (phytanoyl-CoA dioxygenase family)
MASRSNSASLSAVIKTLEGRGLGAGVSLEDSSESNGPLRVLPLSHVHGVLSDADIERWAATVTPVDCVTPSGGVVAMRPLTLHASSKSVDGRPRRVLHIEYAASTDLGNGVQLAIG